MTRRFALPILVIALSLKWLKTIAAAEWFNPRTGAKKAIRTVAAGKTQEFKPPDNNEWVLVIGAP